MSSIPIEVFYSYAERDAPLLKELEMHLRLLQREGLITPWHKRHITAGLDWKKTLDQHLNTASVVLLLISADFVASDYCYGVECSERWSGTKPEKHWSFPFCCVL